MYTYLYAYINLKIYINMYVCMYVLCVYKCLYTHIYKLYNRHKRVGYGVALISRLLKIVDQFCRI